MSRWKYLAWLGIFLLFVGSLVFLRSRESLADSDLSVAPLMITPSLSPVVLSATGTPQSTEAAEMVQIVKIDGGEYFYKPDQVTVVKDRPVKIIFNNVGGFHDLVLDEFNVRTDRVQSGQTAEITFTPDKTGTFEYYCSVGQHRALGMKGTLVVE